MSDESMHKKVYNEFQHQWLMLTNNAPLPLFGHNPGSNNRLEAIVETLLLTFAAIMEKEKVK